MKVSVLRPHELGAAEIGRWREIQRTDPRLASPFLAPEFTQGVGRFRDNVRIAVVTDGPDVVAFFPHERQSAGVGHPVGFGLTDVQGIVAGPELELPARELLKACGLGVWDFDHLLGHQLLFQPHQKVKRVEPIIDLSAGFGVYEEGARSRAPKEHKTIRYKERKLGREAGEVRYEFASADRAELRRLMAWKSDQYNRTGRTDRFARPWIVELVEHFHETGFGVLSVLYAGDRAVSSHFGLRSEHCMAGWFPAYDTEFARYSPGMIGHLRLAQGCAENGVTEIGMGRAGKEFKEWLKNGEFPIAEGRVTRATVGAGVNWVRTVPLSKARNAALDNPKLYARADQVLRTYAKMRNTLRRSS